VKTMPVERLRGDSYAYFVWPGRLDAIVSRECTSLPLARHPQLHHLSFSEISCTTPDLRLHPQCTTTCASTHLSNLRSRSNEFQPTRRHTGYSRRVVIEQSQWPSERLLHISLHASPSLYDSRLRLDSRSRRSPHIDAGR
jgi:hypothetical protein